MEHLGVWKRLVVLISLLAVGIRLLTLIVIRIVEVKEIEKNKRNDWFNR